MLGEQRSIGRRALLRQIRKVGPVPRIDLADQTGISRATVTTVTAELLEHGLIEEIHTLQPGQKRGRPKVDLKIRGDAFLVAGAKLANQSISIVITDFEGQVKNEFFYPLEKTKYDLDELVEQIATAIRSAAKDADIAASDISALGLGLAGMVNVHDGIVLWSPSLSARNVPLGDALSAKLNIPCFIDNDANLVAKAEQLFGMGKDVDDFIVVTIENGVGMGLVLDGALYRGTRGCGAEFGHTKVQLDGALCRCGQRGCLEAYVADYALLREMNAGVETTELNVPADMAELVVQAKSGDKRAQTILARAAKMFAMGLSNLVNIFDPKLIILSGERMQLDFLYADDVLESIKDTVVDVDAPPPKIVVHKWGDMMWATGAAAYAIEGIGDISLKELADHAA